MERLENRIFAILRKKNYRISPRRVIFLDEMGSLAAKHFIYSEAKQ
ncbi:MULTISPECIES: hypothetical protein [Fibrobacter]|nr:MULTISPECIES: hypothetical protein [Fibrobacter]MDD7299123.1 hypothetical protein [Fibrobacter intestinalis]